MTRLDVITDVGVYVLELDPEEYALQENEDADTVSATLTAIKDAIFSGGWFKGWTPYQNADEDTVSVVSIENGAQVKGLRLYELNAIGVIGFSADTAPTPTTPYPFTCFGEYLGNKLKITGVAFRTPITEYLLPIFVNDQRATEYMNPAVLSQQILLAKEATRIEPTEYVIIIPDTWLDFPVAAEYLTAYVQEAEPTTKIEGAGKASAWPGWNER